MDEIQICLALAVLYFTYRYLNRSFSGPSTSSSTSTSTSSSSTNAAQERFNTLSRSIPSTSLTQVTALFPQFTARDVKWEFVRTGSVRSVDVVVQDLLDERRTSVTPPTFLPDEIPQTNPTSASQQAKLPSSLTRPKYESLIDKLKLQSQATTQDLEYSESSSSSSSSSSNASASASASADKGKHTDRSWRDLSVDKKKEMMVLEARRRMLEKDRNKQNGLQGNA